MKRGIELLVFLMIMVCLGALCHFMPEGGIKVPFVRHDSDSITLRFPTLAEVLTPNGKSDFSVEGLLAGRESSMRMAQLPDSVIEARRKLMMYADSLRVADSLAVQDTIKFFETYFRENPSRFICPGDSVQYIIDLIAAIADGAKSGEVGIAHYGDSQIEGDRITGYIREKLQDKFGGSGVGLIPAVQMVPSVSVKQTETDSMKRYLADGTLMQKASHNRYGMLAQVAELDGKSTLQINVTTKKHSTSKTIRLFCSTHDGGLKATVVTPNGEEHTKEITEKNSTYQILEWNLPNAVSNFKLRLEGKAELYGICLTSGKGVTVTNIGLRGSSGTFFTKIDRKSITYMTKAMQTKVVLMEFGGNAVPYMTTKEKRDNYKKAMASQIETVKKMVPGAKIVLIGPADMSESVDGKLQTYRNLEETAEMLKSCASECHVAYWDMYAVMGGRNSMISWVSSQPALAASDYIHFSKRGADRIANLFVESLWVYDQYNEFVKNHDIRKEQREKKRMEQVTKKSKSLKVDSTFADSIRRMKK